jgi:hypothetical protein
LRKGQEIALNGIFRNVLQDGPTLVAFEQEIGVHQVFSRNSIVAVRHVLYKHDCVAISKERRPHCDLFRDRAFGDYLGLAY